MREKRDERRWCAGAGQTRLPGMLRGRGDTLQQQRPTGARRDVFVRVGEPDEPCPPVNV
jgi:hypothetical protein